MLENFAFSTTTFLIASVIAIVFVFSLILGFRYYLAKKTGNGLKDKYQDSKVKKYPEVDVFKMSNQFLALGMVMTLLLFVFAFNWTSYEKEVVIPEDALVLEEDIMVEPPRSAEPPPPPPPPPPPVITEVPNELVMEEDEVEFLDQTIDETTEIEAPKAPVETTVEAAPPPPPPPPPPPEEEEIFVVVEEMPRFPGCEDLSGKERADCANKKMLEFIYGNIQYPTVAKDNGIEGTVVVRFVVNEKGKVSQANVVKDIGAQCGAEALRIVNLMNDKGVVWSPGKQRGKPVKVWFTLPVKFKLL